MCYIFYQFICARPRCREISRELHGIAWDSHCSQDQHHRNPQLPYRGHFRRQVYGSCCDEHAAEAVEVRLPRAFYSWPDTRIQLTPDVPAGRYASMSSQLSGRDDFMSAVICELYVPAGPPSGLYRGSIGRNSRRSWRSQSASIREETYLEHENEAIERAYTNTGISDLPEYAEGGSHISTTEHQVDEASDVSEQIGPAARDSPAHRSSQEFEGELGTSSDAGEQTSRPPSRSTTSQASYDPYLEYSTEQELTDLMEEVHGEVERVEGTQPSPASSDAEHSQSTPRQSIQGRKDIERKSTNL